MGTEEVRKQLKKIIDLKSPKKKNVFNKTNSFCRLL